VCVECVPSCRCIDSDSGLKGPVNVFTMSAKRKHETSTLSSKMDIIRMVDSGSTVAAVATQFNMPRSTIYSILKN